MKKNIMALAALCSSVVTLAAVAPARADVGQNAIRPSVSISGGQTSVGIDSKFGISDNLSVRPFIYFPSGGNDIGSALTYDFHPTGTGDGLQITPFLVGQ
jgi:hypothetical protein